MFCFALDTGLSFVGKTPELYYYTKEKYGGLQIFELNRHTVPLHS